MIETKVKGNLSLCAKRCICGFFFFFFYTIRFTPQERKALGVITWTKNTPPLIPLPLTGGPHCSLGSILL